MSKLGVDKSLIVCYTMGIALVTGWSAYFDAYTMAILWNQVNFY